MSNGGSSVAGDDEDQSSESSDQSPDDQNTTDQNTTDQNTTDQDTSDGSEENTSRFPNADLTVRNISKALALANQTPGSLIGVRGYHRPGDGGGGLFNVTNSACETDGGTCFVFDEHVSSEQSEQLADTIRGKSLAHEDLVWGTIKVEIEGTPNERIIDHRFLHGHTTAGWPSQGQHVPMIDHETGTFADRTVVGSAKDQLGGSGYTVRYKHATSDKRLERLGVDNAVNIDWWGAVEADPADPVNNWWRINWAVNAASELYQNQNIDWAYVDIPGHYYYRYLTRVRDGVKLRGTANQTFNPAANGGETHGKLTLMPGKAMNHVREGFDENHLHRYLRTAAIDLTHARGVHRWGMEDLEVDGNRENNLEPIVDPDDVYGDVRGKTLSGANWNALAGKGSNADQWDPAEDAMADFDDVYFHDFPGNGISANGFDWTPSENIRVKNAFRNHQWYVRERVGTLSNASIEGWAWGSLVKQTLGNYTNIDITMAPNPIKDRYPDQWGDMDAEKVWDHHGKGFGMGWNESADRIDNMQVHLSDFFVNLTKGSNTVPLQVIADRGYGGTYRNGHIITPDDQKTTVIAPVGTGGNGPIRDYRYEDITVEDRGGGVVLMTGGAPHTHLTMRNITVTPAPDVTSSASKYWVLQTYSPGAYAEKDPSGNIPIGMQARESWKNIELNRVRSHTNFPLRDVNRGDHPHDLYFADFSVNNTEERWRPQSLIADTSRESEDAIEHVIRLFLDKCSFNVYEPAPSFRPGYTHEFLLNDENTIRMRNCTTPAGRTSDQTGTYIADDSDTGNDHVLIPTDLITLFQATNVTVRDEKLSVKDVMNADAEGNEQSFDADNRQAFDPRDPYLKVKLNDTIPSGGVTIDWTARVTPRDDYQRTGVFTARDVDDRNLTSGQGPWTVDLRGTMSSQETDKPIMYSASSSDPSVVTASMNSYTNPAGNAIPWELELDEQGTGSANITVTGSIPGVGTASDTFEVTVS